MSITGIGSYDATTGEFNVNWEQANLELAPAGLLLAGDYTQASFETDRTQLLALIAAATEAAADARDTATARDVLKSALLARGKQLRGAILSKVVDNSYLKDLVALPNFTDTQSKFIDPLNALERLWAKINAAGAALQLSADITLQGDYTQAMFAADLTQLGADYYAANQAEENTGFARTTRNNAMAAIYERMKQYRAGATSALPKNSPALANLPRLTPAAGTTPPALVIEGVWDNAIGKAVFTFPASTAKNLLKLQARGCTGTTYRGENEEFIADLLPDATRFETDWGLGAPGAKICVKIYVMTTTGNENGGKAVKIVRPMV